MNATLTPAEFEALKALTEIYEAQREYWQQHEANKKRTERAWSTAKAMFEKLAPRYGWHPKASDWQNLLLVHFLPRLVNGIQPTPD